MFALIKATDKLRAGEHDLMQRIRNRERVARNVNVIHEQTQTFGDRVSDRLATAVGSWRFIISFLVMLTVWMIVNAYFLVSKPFDPYPFILLNLVLSCVAAIQAPVILMSQNRQSAKDRLQAETDFEVNTKAELEIESLQQKLDLLRESQWAELVAMQQRQIEYLEKLLALKAADPISPGDQA